MMTLYEAIEQAIFEGKMLEDDGGEWKPLNLLDTLESAREYEALEQEVTVTERSIVASTGEVLYRFKG